MQAGYVLNNAQQPYITSEREQYLLMAYPHFAEDQQNRLPIEIAVFEATEQMEETIIRWMHRIISNKEQFTIQIAQQIECHWPIAGAHCRYYPFSATVCSIKRSESIHQQLPMQGNLFSCKTLFTQ